MNNIQDMMLFEEICFVISGIIPWKNVKLKE